MLVARETSSVVFGVDCASAVMSMTDSYAAVFTATAAVTLLILALGPLMSRWPRE